ncbi:MAG: division/cell wall cluster transcriptional repressor MraZ [Phycisphaerales bacterium JB065]
MLLIGQFEHTIDAKGRLAVPAEIRGRWVAERDGGAWFAVPWSGGRIRLYTETEFNKRAAAALGTGLTPSEELAELQAVLFGSSARLEMDSAGRVRIPDSMLGAVGLGKEVVLVGCGDRLEIRDRSGWQDAAAQRLNSIPELLRKLEERGKDLG